MNVWITGCTKNTFYMICITNNDLYPVISKWHLHSKGTVYNKKWKRGYICNGKTKTDICEIFAGAQTIIKYDTRWTDAIDSMVQQQNSIIGLMNHQTISMIKFIKNKEKYLNDHTSSYKDLAARYLILLIIYQQIAKVRKNLIFAQVTTNKQITSITYSKKWAQNLGYF